MACVNGPCPEFPHSQDQRIDPELQGAPPTPQEQRLNQQRLQQTSGGTPLGKLLGVMQVLGPMILASGNKIPEYLDLDAEEKTALEKHLADAGVTAHEAVELLDEAAKLFGAMVFGQEVYQLPPQT